MKRLAVTIAIVVLATFVVTACAGKRYEEAVEATHGFEGAQSICQSYYSPPFYYMCWAVKRKTCQRHEQMIDRCMEQRGWRRVQ